MVLNWFNASNAAKIGVALADEYTPQAAAASAAPSGKTPGDAGNGLNELFERADREIRGLQLNFYKKAKFGNAFKWRLIENGVDKGLADEITQRLVLHLSLNTAGSGPSRSGTNPPADPPRDGNSKHLLAQGNKCIAQGDYPEAISFYEDLIRLEPRHVIGHNNLGAALSKLGRYQEAETHFREAVSIDQNYPDAHSNLGNLLRLNGQIGESERLLRRSIKLNPRLQDARVNLGLTLAFMNRTRDAKTYFDKVLKASPRHADALCGLAFVAKTEGRFDDAAALFKRALDVEPRLSSAWAAQVGLRKMTSADSEWLERAEEMAKGSIAPINEAELRFAMGKFCDDVGDFRRAFDNYKRGNDLLKRMAEPYDRDARTQFVDDLVRVHTRETVATADGGTSASARPVFVVGMPRSGTSLTEQIIASHPQARGAGELAFWNDAMQIHQAEIREGQLGEATRKGLAEGYLRVLDSHSHDALRIVDKTPTNADYLGLIHAVFPNARFIYMQRDPIDTCLSCYFQQFSLSMNFTTDMSDLAHYYREHRRLVAHWRAVLPPGTILDVPYADLVADLEGWTRKILAFIGLEWDERCLNFHQTKRAVVTSSFWQVRQKVYKDSVVRWRNYEKFIGPLLPLKNLDR
ncbi:MAG: sulfotransferase [Steroidobacteraceae bacterium]|jgi:tetratricopeptide (TPR) repeat protein